MPKSPARLRDWVFGSTGKRKLLSALIAEPDRRWSKQALADAAGVHRKGGVDGHVLALRQLGLLRRRRGGRWAFVGDSELVEPLRRLLEVLERLPDRKLERP
ncbi:MAG: hypothetical protein ACRDNB_00855 [Gaiellaceae bacterium]